MIFRRTRNGGPAAARNLGAKLATGRYVLFLDADDRLMPGAITAFEAAIAANGEPDAVYGGFILQQPGRPAKRYPAPQTQGDRLADFRAFLETRPRPLTPGGVCVHRRAIARLAFPERLRIAEDLVFFGQLVATSRVVSVPDLVLERFGVARRGTDRAILRADELLHAVDILFDPAILPPPFMTLRNRQLGMTYLTLFRAFQSAGYQTEARRYFWKGARLVPMRAARPTYLRKILRGMFPAARLPEIVDMPAGDPNARREFRQ
jgi:glycosyltransferase involved in cell wall biosynthesis